MKLFLAILVVVMNAFAIPQLINYQGQLTSPTGTPLDTTVAMTFRLYGTLSGGTAIWTETRPNVLVNGGLFQVSLGSISSLPDSFAVARWLGITVGGNSEMTPRQQVVSVAHSYRVGTVDGATGGTILGKLNVGTNNTNEGNHALVFGQNNHARGDFSFIGGGGGSSLGDSNSALGPNSSISGGIGNTTESFASTISGGAFNAALGDYATVGGGSSNQARGDFSFIGGGGGLAVGDSNSALGDNSVISGGMGNTTDNLASTISGGTFNAALGNRATIGGGSFNHARGDFSFIGGGGGLASGDSNSALGQNSTISGGIGNTTESFASTISGGAFNAALGDYATVSGGSLNHARGDFSFIGGGGGSAFGDSNSALGPNSTISGGIGNTTESFASTISGGALNAALGDYSTVAGGRANEAWTDCFAAGTRAKARHSGSFVWSDASTGPTVTTTENEFLVRASGGVRVYADSTLTAGVTLAPGGSAWAAVSDVRKKENFHEVSTADVLSKLSQLKITEWNYKSQADQIRHMGPMAQDFYASFGLGESDTTITTIDADGVLFAAMKGLKQEKDDEIAALRKEVADLKRLVQQITQYGMNTSTKNSENSN